MAGFLPLEETARVLIAGALQLRPTSVAPELWSTLMGLRIKKQWRDRLGHDMRGEWGREAGSGGDRQ